ncbi:uncharacterized protein L201_008022 [Kwoniella dendrophila CBS 6074]|uniref:Peptidase S9 prolyl oligopeptidase catalytic domain-containing protein n=1 Tax=Kwoniella dendrophila CBS 6074 TaxID=1295534 RepID=A0AAX4K8C6_9TREE
MSIESSYKTLTFTYDPINQIEFDIYIPSNLINKHIDKENKVGSLPLALPGVIAFHGGGIVSGSKKDAYFPQFLLDRYIAQNVLFISPNYRLLYPSNGSDILKDVTTLFNYFASKTSELYLKLNVEYGIRLDVNQLGVIGLSGGDYPSRSSILLDNIPKEIKPKVYINFFGQAGDFLLDWWINTKKDEKVLMEGMPFDHSKIEILLSKEQNVISDCPMEIEGDENQRISLCNYFYNKGLYLDYLLSEPGLSKNLQNITTREGRFNFIPKDKQYLLLPFDKLKEETEKPKFLFIHGIEDKVVPIQSSYNAQNQLNDLGIKSKSIWVKGAGHGLFQDGNWPYLVDGVDDIFDDCVKFTLDAFRDN